MVGFSLRLAQKGRTPPVAGCGHHRGKPALSPRPRPADMRGPRLNILAFTCIRNEGPFLLEWIAYHRLIGVTDFLFFSNDCEDGTDHLLTLLARHGVVAHIDRTVEPGESVQWQALKRVAKDGLAGGHDWAMFTDVDEFPMIHTGARRLPDAIAALPDDADALAMPWRLFGAAGRMRFEDRPVTAQFQRSAPPELFHPIAGRYIKTLFRPDRFQKPGVHRPKRRPNGPVPVWYDGAGQRMPDSFAQRDSQISLPDLAAGRSVIELHHYSLRSAESFVVKSSRGLANRRVKSIDLSYWVERNFNTVDNTAMSVWAEALDREIANLRALPGVEALHQQACDWHRRRFAALIGTHPGYRLYSDCLHAADSAALTRLQAMQLYAAFAAIRD